MVPTFSSGIRSVRKPPVVIGPVPAVRVREASQQEIHPHFKPKPFVDSPRPSLAQRFLPFGSSSKRATQTSTLPTEDAAVQDAEETSNRISVPYFPDELGSSAPSPIFYSTPREIQTPQITTSAPPSTPPSTWSKRKTFDGSDIAQISTDIGQPFHFTPLLNPPPAMSSPGRTRPKVRYIAVMDYPEDPARDRKPLPDWLHFSERDIELYVS
jgi:hypothetical protein